VNKNDGEMIYKMLKTEEQKNEEEQESGDSTISSIEKFRTNQNFFDVLRSRKIDKTIRIVTPKDIDLVHLREGMVRAMKRRIQEQNLQSQLHDRIMEDIDKFGEAFGKKDFKKDETVDFEWLGKDNCLYLRRNEEIVGIVKGEETIDAFYSVYLDANPSCVECKDSIAEGYWKSYINKS